MSQFLLTFDFNFLHLKIAQPCTDFMHASWEYLSCRVVCALQNPIVTGYCFNCVGVIGDVLIEWIVNNSFRSAQLTSIKETLLEDLS